MLSVSMFDYSLLEPGQVRPISRQEYDQMVALGMFDDEKVELLRGVLVKMSPQDVSHSSAVEWFTKKLILSVRDDYRVRCQLPFAADDWSEPEPDIGVFPLAGIEHPTTALLLIEVANTSLRKDREIKTPIYAAAGVPEYWILDVATMTVEVHTRPVGGTYTRIEILRDGDMLRPLCVPGVELAVSEIPRVR